MSLVSVVIPAFNRADRIGAAIESVLSQTHGDLEVIVVDDASTDNTTEVAQKWVRNDARVRSIRHERNQGGQAARNSGIMEARGDWIAFLDSDDYWLPNSLKMRMEVAASSGYEVVHSECQKINWGETTLKPFEVPSFQGEVYGDLLKHPGPMFQGLLISKSALRRIGNLDEAIISFQEWDTSIRLAEHYPFAFVPEPTFVYDCRYGDTISSDARRTADGYNQIVEKHRISITRVAGRKTLSNHYLTIATLYKTAGDTYQARQFTRKALRIWPLRPKTLVRFALKRFP